MRKIEVTEFNQVSGGGIADGTIGTARYIDGKLSITNVVACGGAAGAVITSSGGAAVAAGASAAAACAPVAQGINAALQSIPNPQRSQVACGMGIVGGLGPGRPCAQ